MNTLNSLCKFSQNCFLTSRLWIFKWASGDDRPSPHNANNNIGVYERFRKFFSFLACIQVKTYPPYQPCIQSKHYFSYTLGGVRKASFIFSHMHQICTIFVISVYANEARKCVREWHHQLAHLNIHKDSLKKCFPKKFEISKCHNSHVISYPPPLQLNALFCRELFSFCF